MSVPYVGDITYVDIIIAIIVLLYVIRGYQVGIWPILIRFISFVGALLAAFFSYHYAGQLILAHFTLMPTLADVAGFMTVFIIFEIILGIILGRFLSILPEWIRDGLLSKMLAIPPAFLNGVISVSLTILIIAALPVFPGVKKAVLESRSGSFISGHISDAEMYINKLSGGKLEEALTFLTVHPESDESVALTHKPSVLTVDEKSEVEMLRLVNEERAKVGAPALVMDQTIVSVARAHSKDMWERQYFAHENPDGEDPFDRMKEGGVKFGAAGENLALAPTLPLAHRGLMNSPGHRKNILNPEFRRVGIGVIDGGIYGKMFTQDFAD